jgi:hypothetical protein
MPSLPGRRITRSSGTTSRPEGRRKTSMSNPSMAECATNSSTKVCSSVSIMPAAPLPKGSMTTVISCRTHRSDTKHRRPVLGPSPQPTRMLRDIKATRLRRCYQRAGWRNQNHSGSERNWMNFAVAAQQLRHDQLDISRSRHRRRHSCYQLLRTMPKLITADQLTAKMGLATRLRLNGDA